MSRPSTSSGSAMQVTQELSNPLMMKLKPARIFKGAVEPAPAASPGAPQRGPAGPKHITGLSFDDQGNQLITAGEDETFKLYSCKTGKQLKVFYSKKYGVTLPRFTHKSTAIVHASTKEDDTIRYHSLHDNKYLQYFRGHKGTVTSLEVSPVDDGFISGSMDKTVRMWDLRAPTCRGLLPLPSPPVCAYDPSGMVIAVVINRHARVLMFDLANYDKDPFLVVELVDPTLSRISYPPRPICATSLSFSANGKFMLIGCSGDAHYIADAYYGNIIAKLEGHVGLERRSTNAQVTIEPVRGCSGEEVSWTPDSKYVVSGSLDGKIIMWHMEPLSNMMEKKNEDERKTMAMIQIPPLVKLDGHPGPSRCVKFNPRLLMMASAGQELAFWLPDPAPDSEETAKDILKKM
ncbi:WD40-repeat-containing domain protein [Schizophyllum commune]